MTRKPRPDAHGQTLLTPLRPKPTARLRKWAVLLVVLLIVATAFGLVASRRSNLPSHLGDSHNGQGGNTAGTTYPTSPTWLMTGIQYQSTVVNTSGLTYHVAWYSGYYDPRRNAWWGYTDTHGFFWWWADSRTSYEAWVTFLYPPSNTMKTVHTFPTNGANVTVNMDG